MPLIYRPYFWNSQSLLSKGQTDLALSHREMQWKWKAWLQIPQATVHSSLVAEAWFAWHSMHRSMMWFRQIAQLSTTISQAQRATAFHFFTSNFFFSMPLPLAPSTFFVTGASLISTSAMVCKRKWRFWRGFRWDEGSWITDREGSLED